MVLQPLTVRKASVANATAMIMKCSMMLGKGLFVSERLATVMAVAVAGGALMAFGCHRIPEGTAASVATRHVDGVHAVGRKIRDIFQ